MDTARFKATSSLSWPLWLWCRVPSLPDSHVNILLSGAFAVDLRMQSGKSRGCSWINSPGTTSGPECFKPFCSMSLLFSSRVTSEQGGDRVSHQVRASTGVCDVTPHSPGSRFYRELYMVPASLCSQFYLCHPSCVHSCLPCPVRPASSCFTMAAVRKIACIGAGYVGGPTMAMIVSSTTSPLSLRLGACPAYGDLTFCFAVPCPPAAGSELP
jgi:hypothetical protein